ncbi:MAG: hypothetical protein ACREQC_03575 [Candidatus Binataceae bacterium]
MSDPQAAAGKDEARHLALEIHELKGVLREISGRLGRIETRLKRVFPQAFEAVKAERIALEATDAQASLTPETALSLFDDLAAQIQEGRKTEVEEKLRDIPISDLALLARELGVSLGKKRPSRNSLTLAVLGRLKETVMLTKHSNATRARSENAALAPSVTGSAIARRKRHFTA